MSPSTERSKRPKPESVYLFGTCLVDLFFPEAGLAAVELIEREGVRVIYPQDQTCCGQPAFNAGYRREARAVARAQLGLFAGERPVVVPSGSCGAMLKVHYPELFRGEPEEAAVRAWSGRVCEWSAFMVEVLEARLADLGPPRRVTYHPSCHLLRELGVREPPLTLLRQLERVELVSLPDAEDCCGFGGTFAVKMGDLSAAMVRDKCAAVAESGAELVVSMDAGCLLNIEGALRAGGHSARALPLPLFLKRRIEGGDDAA
jgi:L-lactate dehydrogenase complex protein LldE